MKVKFTIILFLVFFAAISVAQEQANNHLLIAKTFNKYQSYNKTINYINTINEQITDKLMLEKAIALYETDEIKASTNLFVEIHKTLPKEVDYYLAKCYSQLNKPKLACQYLENHLGQKNKKPLNFIQSDNAFQNVENSPEWIELWRKKEWYSKYDLMLEEALYELKLGNTNEAFEMLDKLTQIRKSMHIAKYHKALVYQQLGEPQNALTAINAAIERDDDVAKYYLQKSIIELSINKTKKALKSIEKAIELNPYEIDNYFQRSRAYIGIDEDENALNDLKFIENLIDHTNVHKLASEIYFELEDYSKALIAINKCIKTEKHNPQLYLKRALIYSQTYTYCFAEKDYSMALDFLPYEGEIYYERGLTRIEQKNFRGACSDFKKAYQFKYVKAAEAINKYCQSQH